MISNEEIAKGQAVVEAWRKVVRELGETNKLTNEELVTFAGFWLGHIAAEVCLTTKAPAHTVIEIMAGRMAQIRRDIDDKVMEVRES